MFNYTICNEPDAVLFGRQCKALENNISEIVKRDLLHDVDDSLTQIYEKDGARIVVHNSQYIGALFIESEIELTQFFKK